ncbi:MAG: Zn-ribbon-containing protein [Flavobacteriaceae bacterium]|nr:Zn-ribbon-containing protein [Flavobacteriaceae bacterium]
MITVNILIKNNNSEYKDFIDDVYTYIYFLQRSGQILEREQIISQHENTVTIPVVCPEKDALNLKNCNEYALKAFKNIEKHTDSKIEFIKTGIDPDYKNYKIPEKSSFYILRNGWSSPLICGDTYNAMPLYKIPYTDKDKKSYDNINFWNNDYERLSGLWLNGVYEEFAQEELQNITSKINTIGRELCKKIEKITQIPTYYFLFNYRDWSKEEDYQRKCPITKKEWLIKDKTSEDFIAFKCDESRLVSELSTNVENYKMKSDK